ncbi:uncharacterized protein PGRI_057280 [Penicillium griseofulvum]|uniref:NACHT-NTPase and P-loop NTPases N-terminal domain-containing protein n=1 Tax=Penicillium patulum TaxID=5078 RepID=A0A135LLG3_PENPA|nr:uncharacterized protein PGRI_057280 [Penicillium griseofulvum]KXG49760.1 hypothetical protein PGRI_057280 [Penicillium griseofulvum]
MSGIEIIGLISGVITLIDASVTIYKALESGPGLPSSFRDSAARLPLIQESLTLVRENLDADPSSAASQAALKQVLDASTGRATALHDAFQAIVQPPGVSQWTRGLIAMKAKSKASSVDKLISGIMEDLQVLTANHAVKAATRAQVEGLVAEIKQKKEPIRQEDHEEAVGFGRAGSNKQYVYTGVGNQNIASDKATQINGTSFGGVFNFSHN